MKREVVTGFPQRSEICPSFTRLTLGPSGSVCLEHAHTVLGLNPMVVWMGMIPWGGAGELGDSKNPRGSQCSLCLLLADQDVGFQWFCCHGFLYHHGL